MGRREEIPTKLFNVFDGVAPNYFSGLEKYWQQSLKAGAQEVHLAGSGPAMFTLTKDKILARQIYLYLQQWKLESYLIDTLTAKEQ
jgi:4-diphosphocytidyl-2-C-methyl-D-erythritol kinase